MAAKWKGKIIGKYIGPGLPGPTQYDIASNKFIWIYGQAGGASITLQFLYFI